MNDCPYTKTSRFWLRIGLHAPEKTGLVFSIFAQRAFGRMNRSVLPSIEARFARTAVLVLIMVVLQYGSNLHTVVLLLPVLMVLAAVLLVVVSIAELVLTAALYSAGSSTANVDSGSAPNIVGSSSAPKNNVNSGAVDSVGSSSNTSIDSIGSSSAIDSVDSRATC